MHIFVNICESARQKDQLVFGILFPRACNNIPSEEKGILPEKIRLPYVNGVFKAEEKDSGSIRFPGRC